MLSNRIEKLVIFVKLLVISKIDKIMIEGLVD